MSICNAEPKKHKDKFIIEGIIEPAKIKKSEEIKTPPESKKNISKKKIQFVDVEDLMEKADGISTQILSEIHGSNNIFDQINAKDDKNNKQKCNIDYKSKSKSNSQSSSINSVQNTKSLRNSQKENNKKISQEFELIKKKNEDHKNKIKELESRIKELESIIKEKDNIINEYEKKELEIKSNNDNYINRINELEKEIEKYKAYCLLPGEKLITIKFISIVQKINFDIISKNTDNFAKLEGSLYEKYPKYKETENYFLANGKKLNKHKTLDENKINDNDILTLGIIDD